MDVSIQRTRPDAGHGAGLSYFSIVGALVVLISACVCLTSMPAHGYSIQRVGSNGTIRLRPADLAQGGVSLGGGTEQVLPQGAFQGEITDFAQPLPVDLPATLAGLSMTATIDRNQAFVIRLTNAERNQCLTEADFDVTIRAVSPLDGFGSQSGGGQLSVLSFAPVYRDRQGGNCPSHLFYGYQLLLGLDDAAAAGVYASTVEVQVAQTGGGPVESLQTSVAVDMPGVLLLYHPGQITVDIRATAVAGALGASSTCGPDGCLDLGSRTLDVTSLSAPIDIGVSGATSALSTLQTVTFHDAVGARATGCTTGTFDTATFQVLNTSGGIQPGTGPITGIQGAPCTLDLTTGDLWFDLDLSQAASNGASATIQITVTGI